MDHVPDEGDEVTGLRDALLRWRYTLSPRVYTDDDSTTGEQLWQQTIEVRAVRAWLVVCALLLALLCALVFVASLVLALAVSR